MALIKQREFMDEDENFFEARRLIKKIRYKRAFLYLYNQFNHKGCKCITIKMLQEALLIPEFTYAYQILEGFTIMNLLQKQKIYSNVKYLPLNMDWWSLIYKELKKEEEKDGSGGTNTNI